MENTIRIAWILLPLLFLTACTERRQAGLIQAAEEKTAQGRYVEASDLLKKVIAINAQSKPAVRALYKLGFLLETYLHDYDGALVNYSEFVRLSQDAVSVYEVQKRIAGIYFEEQKDPEKTLAAYKKLISLNPDSLEADFFQFQIAEAYFQENNFEQARQEYQLLLDHFPKSSYIPHARFEIGNTYYLEGKNDIAVEALEQVIRHHPQSEYAVEAQFLMAALQIYESIKGRYPASAVLDQRIENLKKKTGKAK
jgi:tetratricopeptide (TPR) repeat protein